MAKTEFKKYNRNYRNYISGDRGAGANAFRDTLSKGIMSWIEELEAKEEKETNILTNLLSNEIINI